MRPETLNLLLETSPAGVVLADIQGVLRFTWHALLLDVGILVGVSDMSSACIEVIARLLEADCFLCYSILRTTSEGLTPFELVATSRQDPLPNAMLLDRLAREQDEAVRFFRDIICAGARDLLPDLVVSTICSFALPRIVNAHDNEMDW